MKKAEIRYLCSSYNEAKMIIEENKQQKSWFDFVYKICNNYVYIHITYFYYCFIQVIIF